MARRTRQPGDDEEVILTIPASASQGVERDMRELVALLYWLSTRMTTLRRSVASSLGLGSREVAVLLAVLHLEGSKSVRVRDIAEQLHTAAANVTVTVAQLEARGLLAKQTDPDDSRALSVSLTPRSREVLGEMSRMTNSFNHAWFNGLDGAELAGLKQALTRLLDQFPRAAAFIRPRQ